MACMATLHRTRKTVVQIVILSMAALAIIYMSTHERSVIHFNKGAQVFYAFQIRRSHNDSPSKPEHDGVVYDKHNLPSTEHSTMYLVNTTYDFKIGDTIHVHLVLHDGYSKPLTRGGDLVLVWMSDPKKGASSSGSVIDHVNGSYTGILRALWTGSAVIKFAVSCTSEGYTMIYQYFAGQGASKNILCIFEANKIREVTMGSTLVDHGNKNVCNLTAENYGLPWFCGKPKSTRVQCSDWTKLSHESFNSKTLYQNKTAAQYYLRATYHRVYTHSINITVRRAPTQMIPPNLCTRDAKRQTWTSSSPVGYFLNNTWKLLPCQLTHVSNYNQCFQNRRIIMFGDSTVRQWFLYLFNKLELKFSTQIWNGTKWHRQSAAYKTSFNYELTWTRHGLPIYFGEINRGETRPVFVSLDEIPPGSTDIILIHLYAHFQYHHPSVFKTNIRRTVRSLKELIVRAPRVSIAIKGPHHFSFRDRKTLGGMWGPIYDHILKAEFKDLYHKVWFLDVWDMTVARESRDVHPSSSIVKSMVNMFVDFVCS